MARRRKADLPRDDLGRLREPGEPDAMAHLRGLAERIDDPAEAMRRGVDLFDAERFFEAYVYLALAWKRTREPADRGLAQVAAGFCHIQRGNEAGARRLLSKGCDLLAAADRHAPLRGAVDTALTALDRDEAPAFPRLGSG